MKSVRCGYKVVTLSEIKLGMNRYITSIKINNLYHLHDFTISIEDDQKPHLFITGKNGSGKTVLLKAIAGFIESVKNDTHLNFIQYHQHLDFYKERLEKDVSAEEKLKYKNQYNYYQSKIDELYGKVNISFSNVASIIEKFQKGDFILAFYEATRKVKMEPVTNLYKPQIKEKMKIDETSTTQFLYYLTDLKIQEALARNEQKFEDADKVKVWFDDFANLLRKIFNDETLVLDFEYKNYNFTIKTDTGKSFDFNQMSDGYAAILDIVVDLIMRMQSKDTLTRAYEKEGIVLIDEIETHLHLQLQKDIMPLLTHLFPNIQFIVTTHSPFVLNSIDNGVAYDLEHHEPITDLMQYSYSALVEGYFNVDTESSYVDMQIENFEKLLKKEDLTMSDRHELKDLKCDLDKVPEWSSPNIVGRYRELLINYNEKIKSLEL